VGKPHTRSQRVQQTSPATQESVESTSRQQYSGAVAHVCLQAEGLEELVVQVHRRGSLIRESTKQPNKRVAEQIEAAHKVSLAKAEVGIREKKPVPKLREFIDNDFAPFVESRFANKAKTLEYYRIGLKNLREFEPLASSPLDAITGEL
jgi:hypothetical protein